VSRCRDVERSKQINLALTEQRGIKNGLACDAETKQQFKAEEEGREWMSVVRMGAALSEARVLTIANNLWWRGGGRLLKVGRLLVDLGQHMSCPLAAGGLSIEFVSALPGEHCPLWGIKFLRSNWITVMWYYLLLISNSNQLSYAYTLELRLWLLRYDICLEKDENIESTCQSAHMQADKPTS
jgi:hypothetical protein